ncbi:DUF4255 domain-containing protein [Aquimarina sp. AD10]|uniref:Pvc16 N-terminal domain-containing protein n=1 Tax=Aquimarina aggregata TaxID=1642818 RepID=A0A162WJR7_9FLAO|nr:MULTISPECIES: DUF4255 domain-containing protein [Aquimarina]AXT61562.1 DUF4255 domain-containing protein [Aquimarina sp. AD10]KZS38142.1 hypothetical protein AWE51_19045 [Aquimarina aggregata]RKM90046.1 DUF4255 domain-containing protein [Aquimarina sp. AD10]
MIGSALKLLRDELSTYVISNKRPDDTTIENKDIILHNISLMEGESQGELSNKIVITLVNTEEESTLKNGSHILRTLNGVKYVEPPVFLNLYILISATLGQETDAYELALQRLSLVIQFFQAKKSFTIKNSPFSSIASDTNISQEDKDEVRLNVELYTLTFEQINHLWGSLGGKQVPFAMYKIRLVKIDEKTSIVAPVIEEIENRESQIN